MQQKRKPLTRRTKQRELILETLRSTDSHPTADWIYDQVRKKMPHISLGTVYRNLGILKECGEILELNYGSRYSRFDGNAENHYHFVCVQCDKVLDVKLPVNKEAEALVEEQEGVEVHFHRTEFYGLCSDCKREKENTEKKAQ